MIDPYLILSISFFFIVVDTQATATTNLYQNFSYYSTTLGFPNEDIFELTAELVQGIPLDACDTIETATGKIVIVTQGNCCLETKMRNAQNAGAIALLLFYGDGYGHSIYTNNYNDNVGISIRGVEVAYEFLNDVLEQIDSSGSMIAISPAKNMWLYYTTRNNIWILVSIITGTANLALIMFSAYRISEFMLYGLFAKVALTCYSLIIVGAIIRLIACLDYYGAMQILPFAVRAVLLSLYFPFSIASTFVVGFYWLEIFSRKNLVTKVLKLRRYVAQFSIIIIILFLMEIVTCSLRALLFYSQMVSAISIFAYLIMDLGTLLFFSYSCSLLWDCKKASTKLGNMRANENISKTSNLLIHLLHMGLGQILIIFLLMILTALLLLPELNRPIPGVFVMPFIHLAVSFFCWIQACMFRAPQKEKTNHSPTYEMSRQNSVTKLPALPDSPFLFI